MNNNIIDVSEVDFETKVLEESSNRLVVVDFWAPWCGPCKQLTPILEKVISSYPDKVVLAKINIDENQQIAAQLRIQSIPAVFAFKDKQPVDAFQGVIPETEVIKFLEKSIGEKLANNFEDFYDQIRELFNEITDEPCLLEFYVAEPHNYVANPHTDRGRSVAINIPVQVNLEKSDAYFGKYTNLDDYQHTAISNPYTFKLIDSKGKAKQEINQHFRGKYQAELYDSVNFDKSVVFNPAMPHGGYNNSDEIRVLLSLSWFNTSFEEFTSTAKDLGYIL